MKIFLWSRYSGLASSHRVITELFSSGCLRDHNHKKKKTSKGSATAASSKSDSAKAHTTGTSVVNAHSTGKDSHAGNVPDDATPGAPSTNPADHPIVPVNPWPKKKAGLQNNNKVMSNEKNSRMEHTSHSVNKGTNISHDMMNKKDSHIISKSCGNSCHMNSGIATTAAAGGGSRPTGVTSHNGAGIEEFTPGAPSTNPVDHPIVPSTTWPKNKSGNNKVLIIYLHVVSCRPFLCFFTI